MTSALTRTLIQRTDTGGKGPVKTEAEMGVMQSQATGTHQKLGEAWDGGLLRASGRNQP